MKKIVRSLRRDIKQYGLTPPKLIARLTAASYPPVLANSIPKSGTNMLTRLLYLMEPYSRKPIRTIVNSTDGGLIKRRLASIQPGQFAPAHLYHSDLISELIGSLGMRHIMVVRDPRDIVVSNVDYITRKDGKHRLHHYFKNVLANDDERIVACISGVSAANLPDGIESKGIGQHLRAYSGWLQDNNCLVVRFEDLVGERGGGDRLRQLHSIERVSAYLGVVLPQIKLENIAEKLYSDESRTFVNGQIGGWHRRFSKSHEQVFMLEAGKSLTLLGYD